METREAFVNGWRAHRDREEFHLTEEDNPYSGCTQQFSRALWQIGWERRKAAELCFGDLSMDKEYPEYES